MVELTGKGLTKLEKIQDYFPPKGQAYSLKMRQKYLLQEVYKDPNFSIDPSSILRNDWNKLVDQGLIIETSTETICIEEGTGGRLYGDRLTSYVRVTRPSDSDYRLGQVVPKLSFDEMVEAVEKEGGEIPLGEDL